MILDKIVEHKKLQIEKEKRETPIEKWIELSQGKITRNFKEALQGEDISVIAEIKKASPSKGIIKEDFDVEAIAKVYEKIKVNAISVLTEQEFFKGKDSFIEITKAVNSKPILRKDFIIDPYQIYQAKAIGADAILLIAALLPGKLKDYYDLATSIGLHVLIEVHNKEELEETLKSGGEIIGINNRDLKTFKEDLTTTEKLIKYIPKDKVIVSESSIKTSEDIRYLKSLGVSAVLIGETFMRNIEYIERLEQFLERARE